MIWPTIYTFFPFHTPSNRVTLHHLRPMQPLRHRHPMRHRLHLQRKARRQVVLRLLLNLRELAGNKVPLTTPLTGTMFYGMWRISRSHALQGCVRLRREFGSFQRVAGADAATVCRLLRCAGIPSRDYAKCCIYGSAPARGSTN